MAKRNLSKAQRQWVLNRDGHQCCHHTWYPNKGFVRCPSTSKLEVHHIKPHRYLAQFYAVIVELPTNLITLCRTHHHMVHPDMAEAFRNYHGNGDVFKETFAAREIMLSRGIKYWNDHWDTFYKFWAREATLEFAKKNEWPNGTIRK